MKKLADIATALGVSPEAARVLMRRARIEWKRAWSDKQARRIRRRLLELVAADTVLSQRGQNLTREEASTLAQCLCPPTAAYHNVVLPWEQFRAMKERQRQRRPLKPNSLAPLDRLMAGR
jgi:hypothetical protein